MNSRTRRTALAIGLVALMGMTLAVLAVLQYRWISDVSLAERTRLRVSLDNAVQQFRTEFNAELRRVCVAFELEPDELAARNWNRLIERYEDWLGEERHTKLVEDVFLLTSRPDGEMESQWLDAQAGQWLPAGWPGRLDPIRKQLDRRVPGRGPGPVAGRFSLWRVLAEDFVLVQPLVAPEINSGAPELAGYLVLVLSRQYFQDVFLPEMLHRYFRNQVDTDFEAAVVMGSDRGRILCASDLQPPARLLDTPEIRVRLLWDRSDLMPMGAGVPPPLPRFPLARRNRRAPFLSGGEANDWEIVASYRGGSLEEIAARSRGRSLAVSFGVLLLLGAGMTVIVLGARRAHKLADLQMKFVAGVSHDLRTPLAVICSAADNLAEGVIEASSPRVKEYGALIRTEGRKLKAMVEQTLHYASLQAGSRKIDLQPVTVLELVNTVLADEQATIKSLEMTVETDIPSDLPAVLCHRASLQQALRNLVSNSLKHGASGHWMCIRAAAYYGGGKNEVSISVEDRGPGIDAADLPHLFEPFYRGRNAEAAGVPGSGLGLSVVDQSISAMGGRVEVRSVPGRGSTFNLYLPASPDTAADGQDKI
jgi:signal transduction histidine kinase